MSESFPTPPQMPRGKEFKDKLDGILGQQIDVGNIDDYVQKAVNGLIEITEEIIAAYRAENPEDHATGKELEDHAYKSFNLTDIEQYLVVGDQKLDELKEIDDYIRERVKKLATVITPPDKGTRLALAGGNGRLERASIKPRFKTLLYLLRENGIALEEISCFDGIVNPEMMRTGSYVSVVVPPLDRLILVCDEEGNASYVFDLAKMAESNLEAEDINNMTKDEKNELIAKSPGIGKRIIYNEESWRNRMETAVTEEISTDTEGDERKRALAEIGMPKVSTLELDPWRGFWTDPKTGKHWGSAEKVASRIGFDQSKKTHKIIKSSEIEKRSILNGARRLMTDAYSVEDASQLPEIKQRIEESALPRVDSSGEWRGLWTDPATGEHWGAIPHIAEKIGIGAITVKNIVKELGLKTKGVLDALGRPIPAAYSLEEVLALPQIKQRSEDAKLPKAEAEGEWKGFWTDPETGEHWGAAKSIGGKLGLSGETITREAGEHRTRQKKLLSATNVVFEGAYSLEEISQLPKIKQIVEESGLPKVESEGEWKDFWKDPETGKHWGSINAIAKKIGTFYSKTRKIAGGSGLPTKKLLNTVNQSFDGAYSLEDFSALPEIQKELEKAELPKAEGEGEWKDFWIDPQTGNHWGALRSISRKLGKNYGITKKNALNNFPLEKRNLKDSMGRMFSGAYCFEEIEQLVKDGRLKYR